MSFDRELHLANDIVEEISAIDSYIEGLTLEAFAADRKTVDATERCLMRLTEAVIRLGEEPLHRIAPEVPFHLVRALGNALRHEYDRIDLRRIFETLHHDLPLLDAAMRRRVQEG